MSLPCTSPTGVPTRESGVTEATNLRRRGQPECHRLSRDGSRPDQICESADRGWRELEEAGYRLGHGFAGERVDIQL